MGFIFLPFSSRDQEVLHARFIAEQGRLVLCEGASVRKEGSASVLVAGGEVGEGLSPVVPPPSLVEGGEGCPPSGVSVMVSAGSLAKVIVAGVANGLVEGVAFGGDGVEPLLPGVLISSKDSPVGRFVEDTALTQSLMGGCSVSALTSTR